jgi:prefoldin subunit 5
MRRIRSQQNAVMSMLQENAIVGNALKYLDEKNETEAIVPLGAGISMKAKVRGKELLRTLPGNVVVPATKKKIEEDLAERKKIFEKEMEVLQKQLGQAREYAKNMQTLAQAFRDSRKAKKR